MMHHKIIRNLMAGATFLFFFTQCAPIPVYRLHPVENTYYSRWVRGHQVLKIDGQKYNAALAFAKQVNSMLAFDLQIINKSDSTISVIPDSIYSITYTKAVFDSLGRQASYLKNREIFAHNPEEELIRVDTKKHHENARIATARFMDATSSMLDVVYDVSSAIKPPSPQQQREHEHDEIENEAYMTKREVQHANILRSLGAQHFQWSTEALRRTDLTPNETIRGLVFITADPDAKLIGLHLNIAGEEHLIYFSQKKYK